MIRLGQIQELQMVKKVEFGIYLSPKEDHSMNGNQEEKILLPGKQVPEGLEIGDSLEVFVYKDSKDRLIATTNTPYLTLGKVARLKVAQVTPVGAFLDWGLEKELLLPFKEQTKKVEEGEECVVALYTDKSNRMCATMKLYPYLKADSPYQKDDRVTGYLYELSEMFGAYVAVDDKYLALVPPKEMYGELQVGRQVEGRVVAVKEDGKLDLSIREKGHIQMETNAIKIMEQLEANGGKLPFHDKSSPEIIKAELGMSKSEFKRGVGNLLKAGKIKLTDQSIEKVTK